MVEKLRNAKNTVEFKREGEYWICVTSSNVIPNKKYKIKPSEEVVTTGPMGKGLKVYKKLFKLYQKKKKKKENHYSTLSLA